MKKFILSLFVGLFGLIGFGNCDTSFVVNTFTGYETIDTFSVVGLNNVYYSCDGLCCFKRSGGSLGNVYVYLSGTVNNSSNRYQITTSQYVCLLSGDYVFWNDIQSTSASRNVLGYKFNGYNNLYSFSECQECQECPSTGDILSGYILESDITQNYCEVEFGLITPENCPSYGSGEGTGDIMWSSFYVNDEQILGGANIYLTIPDYLKWDYTYVDQDLEIDVENEGDEEYIQGIIDINSYRPTSEDFTDIFVSGLTLVMPYIVIILFIVFVWKLIKRIFK